MAAAVFDTLDIRSLKRGNCGEYWINSVENHTEGIGIIQRVFEFLKTRDAKAFSIRLFGKDADIAEASGFLETTAKDIACPPVCILQDTPDQRAPLKIQVYALSGASSTWLYFKDTPVGREFEDTYAKYYMLSLLPDDRQESEYRQTKNVFEKAYEILESFGLNFSDTIRTWLFARDILSWYDRLNEARNQFFQCHNIYDRLIPASTGIGVMNAYGTAIATQFLAIKPKRNDVTLQSLNSPLQCSAMDYKSSFSRAARLLGPNHNRLYVSGTASIDKTGKTVFIDDAPAQIETTMQAMKAILNNADMDWSNTVSSLAYFKHHRDFGLFDDYCRKNGIKLPHIKIQADICRDNLLFELELDAISTAII